METSLAWRSKLKVSTVFGLAFSGASCCAHWEVLQVRLGGNALTQYNSEKQALLNSGSLSCPSCSTFFNGDPTRASYFGQLTNAVTTRVPYDGVQSTISQYDAGMFNTILTANNPIAVRSTRTHRFVAYLRCIRVTLLKDSLSLLLK